MNYLNWNFQGMSEKSAGRHGMVKASGTSFIYQDGSAYHPFGTTIYALAHQTELYGASGERGDCSSGRKNLKTAMLFMDIMGIAAN